MGLSASQIVLGFKLENLADNRPQTTVNCPPPIQVNSNFDAIH